MANNISLNTTDHPALTQVLVNTPLGLFDYKAQQSAGAVVITDPRVKAALMLIKHPTTGKPFLKET